MIIIRLNKNNSLPSEYYYYEGFLYGINPTIKQFSVKFIPRKYKKQCVLKLRNELTNETQERLVNMINKSGIVKVDFHGDIQDYGSYEMLVTDLKSNELFRGKAFATLQNNLQEYSMNTKINNKIII
jgi:predicted ATP-grasp superfamily ATP-dependent carboligase